MGGPGSGRKGNGGGSIYNGLLKTSSAPYIKSANRKPKKQVSAYEKMYLDFAKKHGKTNFREP